MAKKTYGDIDLDKPSGDNDKLSDFLKQIENEANVDFLDKSQRKRWPVDLHPKLHKEIDRLQFVITGPNGEKVNNRMLVTEAFLDLFEKYERKSAGEDVNTTYEFEEGETFKRSF